MTLKCYIRKEFKNKWEARTPLSPAGVHKLVSDGLPIWVERSDIRVYPDGAYAEAGATLTDNLDDAQIVLGIKEPPVESIAPEQVHLAFSHTIKGQTYNMALLQKFLVLQGLSPVVPD